MSAPFAMSRSAEIPLPRESELAVAFDRLARRHAADIYRLAWRISGSAADAEDLSQETFLRAWRGLRRFRGEATVRTWLIRILLNVAGERRRRRRPGPAGAEVPDRRAGDPAEDLARRDLLRRVLGAVHALPRRQREAMLLRVRGELTYREIAEIMAIRPGVVKLHLVAARRTLARKFGEELEA